MRILVGIPCLYGVGHTQQAIDSVINEPYTELLLIDNGAEDGVKNIINTTPCHKIHNEHNIYVNPAWNQIIDFFLVGNWDALVIMNSDLILKKGWSNNLRSLIKSNRSTSFAPVIINDNTKLESTPERESIQYFNDGVAGVCITLTREQAGLIFPIPKELKVWFGDNWIYNVLNKYGHKTAVTGNLIAYHGVSQTISRVKGIDKVIEQDKIEWSKIKETI